MGRSSHCAKIHAKARRICGVILHSFVTRDHNVLMKAFNTYVLPILMYSSCVWSPKLAKNINIIESVLGSFSYRLICPPFAPIDYVDRLAKFGITSLFHRRIIRDLRMVHKIAASNSEIYSNFPRKCSNFFSYHLSGVTRASADNKFMIPLSRLEVRHQFFSIRVLNLWNSLPEDIVTIKSASYFKKAVKEFVTNNIANVFLF